MYYFVQHLAFVIFAAFIDDPAYVAIQEFILSSIVYLAEVNCWASASVAKVVADAVRVADSPF